MRNGHSEVLAYRIGFFRTCIDELQDHITETIRYNALSHRLSKLDTDEFDKMMNEDVKEKGLPIVVDHEANIRQMQGH